MKQKELAVLTEKFKEFLEKNGLIFEYNHRTFSTSYMFTKTTEKQQQKHHIETFFREGFDRINNPNYMFMFVKTLLSNKETQEMALSFLKSKEPSNKAYSYESFTKQTLSLLEPYKNLYVSYISRKVFLEQHYTDLDSYFQKISDQESREKIINTCLTTRTFTSLDTQTKIYNFIQKHIRNKKAYDEFFPSIKKIDENKDLFENSTKQEVITYHFNISDLNSLNLNKDYGVGGIIYRIQQLSTIMNEMIESKELNINVTHTQCEKLADNKMQLQLYGQNLEHNRLNYLINTVLKNVFITNDEKVTPLGVKEALATADKIVLSEKLEGNMLDNEKVVKRNKL